jgi:hypothetical protein
MKEEEFKKKILEKYKKHFEHCERLLVSAEQGFTACKVPWSTMTVYQRVVSLIFQKAFKSFLSVIRLCQISLTEDAGIILRSMFNLLVIAAWIRHGDSARRAQQYMAWFHVETYRMLAEEPDALNRHPEVLKNYNAAKHLFERTKKGRTRLQSTWHGTDIKTMSKDVGLSTHYEKAYRFLSSFEHSDAMAYVGLMKVKNGDAVLEIYNELLLSDYLEHAFDYFRYIFKYWNDEFRTFAQTDLDSMAKNALEFFNTYRHAEGSVFKYEPIP